MVRVVVVLGTTMIGQTGRGDRRGDHDSDRRLVVDAGQLLGEFDAGQQSAERHRGERLRHRSGVDHGIDGPRCQFVTKVENPGAEFGKDAGVCSEPLTQRGHALAPPPPWKPVGGPETFRPLDHRPTLDSRCDRRRKTVAAGREELGTVIEPGLARGRVHPSRRHPATNAATLVDNPKVVARHPLLKQATGSGEPGDAGADHENAHGSSLADSLRRRVSAPPSRSGCSRGR